MFTEVQHSYLLANQLVKKKEVANVLRDVHVFTEVPHSYLLAQSAGQQIRNRKRRSRRACVRRGSVFLFFSSVSWPNNDKSETDVASNVSKSNLKIVKLCSKCQMANQVQQYDSNKPTSI